MANSDDPGAPTLPPNFDEERRPKQPYRWDELLALPERDPLIKQLLYRRAMSVVYGATSSGKTFFALDIALRVALDFPWCGLKVRQGGVLYIAAEGGLGLKERLTAFQLHHSIGIDGVPFWVLPRLVNLQDPKIDTADIIEEIRLLPERQTIELIVIDTLARAMVGGNENSPEDMGTFVHCCDLIRQEIGAHVMIIHHSGKDQARGSRGHTSLTAATDTEIEIGKDKASGTVTATVRKQREIKSGQTHSFRLEEVELDKDEDGDPITSCVLVAIDSTAAQQCKALTGHTKIAYEALVAVTDRQRKILVETGEIAHSSRTSIPCSVASWREEFNARCNNAADIKLDTLNKRFKRAWDILKSLGLVEIRDDEVWLVRDRRT